MTSALGIDTKVTLLAAGLIFLLALGLGVWKYRQIMVSDEHRAHPYVDIAHRAALLYSFATLLIAVFVALSAWPAWVNLTAAMVAVFFFVAAIGSLHRARDAPRHREPIRASGAGNPADDGDADRRRNGWLCSGFRRLRGWTAMDPVEALRQIAYYKDRDRQDPRRVMAYRNAADILEDLDEATLERHGQANSWQSIPGIGPKTAKVIAQAWAGREPDQLAELRAAAGDLGGGEVRAALRGDLHLHSNWSDGSAPIEEMMATAATLGHEYCALTDHSPRLTIANGLSPERLRKQLDVIDELRDKFAPMRILSGIEVDILDDGSLDQEPELLERLDVVVASVHSKLSMDSAAMTRRMVRAVSDGHADVLGHCTGRLVSGNRGIRAESKFDAEAVFTACRDHGTAVEINSRPERRDPPTRLLNLALEIGCVFSIDTDAHAPGQLDFLGYGAQRALDAGVPVERIVNTWPVESLLKWTASAG